MMKNEVRPNAPYTMDKNGKRIAAIEGTNMET